MKSQFFLFLWIVLSPSLLAECLNETAEKNKKIIGAKYLIKQNLSNKPGKAEKSEVLQFWRMNEQVLLEYPDKKYAEIWEKSANHQIRPVHFYDQYQRGIEYHPEDVSQNKNRKQWLVKYQLVDSFFLQTDKLVKQEKRNCKELSFYASDIESKKVVIAWLDAYQLPELVKVETSLNSVSWELQSLTTDVSQVAKAFKQRDDYQLTDYADIGDNESDPFLLKMVNLGFSGHSGLHFSKNTDSNHNHEQHDGHSH